MPQAIKNVSEWKKQKFKEYAREVSEIKANMNEAKEKGLLKNLNDSLNKI